MSLAKLSTLVGLGVLLFSAVFVGAWEIDDYENKHKPMAQEMWSDYKLRTCLQDCRESQLTICEDLQIAEEHCPVNCDEQCNKYRQVER
jgi:hypothetical protein